MKTTKKLIALALVLAMGAVAMIPSTFSWYDHNDSQTGWGMGYHKNNLPLSSGSISSLETKKYRMDENDDRKIFYDDKGNKEYDGGAITSGSVGAGKTQYYGTTFSNIGIQPVYVNLYLKDFKHDPQNYVGTIAPSLTHKGLSSSVHLANSNSVRIYFQWDNANKWNDEDAKHYVVFQTKDSSGYICFEDTSGNYAYTKGQITKSDDATLLAIQKKILCDNKNELINKIEATYYVDLPSNTTEFYFATDGHDSGVTISGNTLTVKKDWYRTKAITNIHAETGYYLTGNTDDTTGNAQYTSFNVPGGISVNTYYDTVTMAAGQHAYITLNNGVHFTGESVAYSNGTGNVTVNANTGYVTAANNYSIGSTATLNTTITGSLGDTKTITTNIQNPDTLDSMPVASNVEVPGGTSENPGTVEIVWYIQNDSENQCTFSSAYYTK